LLHIQEVSVSNLGQEGNVINILAVLLLIASRLMLLHAENIYDISADITHFLIRYHSVIHTKGVTGNNGERIMV
jgi:hypothetical protein